MFLLFRCGDGLKIFNNVSIEKLSVGLQRFILSRSTSKCKHIFIYISDMEGEGWGWEVDSPTPYASLEEAVPLFPFSPRNHRP